MKDLLNGVRTPSNIFSQIVNKDESKILMEFPADGSYVEILGHRIDGFESFEAFMEYLKKLAALDEENIQLKEEVRRMKNEKADLMVYLEERLEESKIFSTYGGQVNFVSIQERIYEDILNKVKGE